MTAIQRAAESYETTGYKSEHHFRDVTKLITHGKGGQREIDDSIFTRYACSPDPSISQNQFSDLLGYGREYPSQLVNTLLRLLEEKKVTPEDLRSVRQPRMTTSSTGG